MFFPLLWNNLLIYILSFNCCGEPAIWLHSYTVPLVQWSTCLLGVMRYPVSNLQGGTYVKLGFSCQRFLATLVTPSWLIIVASSKAPSSRTVTSPLCWQCDNPTWSQTAFLSRFHTRLGPPSGFTTNIVGCWGEPCGDPAIPLHSYTVLLV
jgi:hypothetical protein